MASFTRHEEAGQTLRMGHRNVLGKWLSADNGRKEEKEDKTELSGKVDDASGGNIGSSMWMIDLEVASSTIHQTATVPPSILVGGAMVALVPASVVGGMGGHMKLEPLAKFNGKGFATI